MYSIYLSPSTQDKNLGVRGYGTEEQRMNDIADLMEPALKKLGITVYRNNPGMGVVESVKDSNLRKPTIHLAIHSNACNGKARGCDVFFHKAGGQGEKFAKIIYHHLSPITPVSDRGVHEGQNHFGPGKPLYETAYTTAPAALVEVSFHDNVEDAAWIIDNLRHIAQALVDSVVEMLDIKPPIDTYQDDICAVARAIGIDAEYWGRRSNIDPHFKGLVHKLAEYIRKEK
ncbi:MAG: N-acetylmuramoyl-L-alanine amidase [Ignavibacteria bacterium]|jgi:N-acetylmuramoyl-L-alanine amidase|nr:N-acetylmuramoyl-L-alanine amidase [Ignavibacteria bacterium]